MKKLEEGIGNSFINSQQKPSHNGHMNKVSSNIITMLILFFALVYGVVAQELITSNKKIDKAFKLALNTIDSNTRKGILAAGADYGGEWTRDISINSWNGVSLLRPEIAKNSLWSVTVNHDTIGHQYWDKILWVIGSLNYFKVNGDTLFLRQAYSCSKKTIESLERHYFDKSYGLFTGPSVFNDGIAGYPEPIFEPTNSSSYVLDHKNSATIKCLSTNCIYYGAYLSICEMEKILNLSENIIKDDLKKAALLKASILKQLYNAKEKSFIYLIDNQGKIDNSQEALGISFAIIFGIIKINEAREIVKKIHVSDYGITSIYPDFPRYSPKYPGRHNNIVWPMVNGFWARACKVIGDFKRFDFELSNLAALAVDSDKGNLNFREIYNPYSGKPDGGWQSGRQWESFNHQTWSATAFTSMIFDGVLGLNFESEGISFKPFLPISLDFVEIKNLRYRNAQLNIKVSGHGSKIRSFAVNNKIKEMAFIPFNSQGVLDIAIELK